MGRSPCCEKEHTNKGAWTKQEDQTLINHIRFHGEGCWRSLPKAAGLLRCGKSCRLRWINYLRPDLKRGNFTQQEDELIITLHSLLGNKWSLIATRLSGRTDNEIKNYWNTHIKRKLQSRGIDPQTHRQLDPLTGSPNVATKPTSPTTTNTFTPIKNQIKSTEPTSITLKTELSSSSSSDSGVTTEDILVVYPEINLELSIGLPLMIQPRTSSSNINQTSENQLRRLELKARYDNLRESCYVATSLNEAVCLCCSQLRFGNNMREQECSCKSMTRRSMEGCL